MIKGMTLSKGGSRLPLILGLILGLVAAVLVVVYLTSAKDEGGSTSSSSGEGEGVVVATKDIPPGTQLTADMFTVKTIPASDVLLNAFKSTEGLTNQVTRFPIVAGEQIHPSKIQPSSSTGQALE